MKKQFGTIYIIRNKLNNQLYVGQTKNWNKRWDKHKNGKLYIDYAMRKNGYENFEFYFLNDVPIELWDYFEIELIKRLDTVSPNGYNLTSGGNKNKIFSEESKEKNRQKHLGKPSGMKGKKQSEEIKQKISNSLMGQKAWNKGIPMSKKTKEKLKNSLKGRTSPHKDKKLSPQHCHNLSISHIGKNLGKDHPRARKVICLNTLKIFESISEIKLKYSIKHISECCRGFLKIAGKDQNGNKLHWLYYSDYQKLMAGEFTFRQIYDQYKKEVKKI